MEIKYLQKPFFRIKTCIKYKQKIVSTPKGKYFIASYSKLPFYP